MDYEAWYELLVEETLNQLIIIEEYVSHLPEIKTMLTHIEEDMIELNADLKEIRLIV